MIFLTLVGLFAVYMAIHRFLIWWHHDERDNNTISMYAMAGIVLVFGVAIFEAIRAFITTVEPRISLQVFGAIATISLASVGYLSYSAIKTKISKCFRDWKTRPALDNPATNPPKVPATHQWMY